MMRLSESLISRLTFKVSMSVSVRAVLIGYVLNSCRFKMKRKPKTGMEDNCMFVCEFLPFVSDGWMLFGFFAQ